MSMTAIQSMNPWFTQHLNTLMLLAMGVVALIGVIFVLKDHHGWIFSREVTCVLLGLAGGAMVFVSTITYWYLDDYQTVREWTGKDVLERGQIREFIREENRCVATARAFLTTMDGVTGAANKIQVSRLFTTLYGECQPVMVRLMDERVKKQIFP